MHQLAHVRDAALHNEIKLAGRALAGPRRHLRDVPRHPHGDVINLGGNYRDLIATQKELSSQKIGFIFSLN